MRFDFLTIFPDLFAGFLESGLIRQGTKKGILDLRVHDLRDFTNDRHKTVDDVPYGGGPGMVFKPEPIFEAVDALRQRGGLVLFPSPQGERFNSLMAEKLAGADQLIFLCARYEGVDERVCEVLVDQEISVGDFVTMGGEIPSLLIAETILRFVPGVVGKKESVHFDSFQESMLDYPHYTRPEEYRGRKVPEVLLSGNHEQIRRWRRKTALKRTLQRRPDLLEKLELSQQDRSLLEELKKEL